MTRTGASGLAGSVAAIGGAVAVGAMTVLQARLNGQLAEELGDSVTMAAISFGSGLVLVAIVALAMPSCRASLRRLGGDLRTRSVPWYLLLGGVAGAVNVVTQGLTVAIIGAALFTVGLVAGQTVGGLVFDRTGYSPSGVQPVTLSRVVGAVLAIAAVVVSLGSGTVSSVPLWLLALPMVTGVVLAWQQATNGRLRIEMRSSIAATFVSFLGGTIVLVVVALAHGAVAGLPAEYPTNPLLYAGGALGVAYVILTAAITPRTGVLLFGLASVVGLLIGAVVLDVLWPVTDPSPAWITAVTVALALSAVVVAAIRRTPRRRGD